MESLDKKTDAELVALLAEKRSALRAFRFGVAGSKTRNVREGRALKREISVILTLISARGITA